MSVATMVWRAVRDSIPPGARIALRKFRLKRDARSYSGLSRKEIFTRIYAEGTWGDGAGQGAYDSGWGSHDPAIVAPYVAAVSAYLDKLGKPDVVDLGCGDFAIGSKLRAVCGGYVAADIVEPLIVANRERFAGMAVRFEVIDAVADPLPAGDVVFLRQVLQHLGNADVAAVLAKITTQYRHLIVTEHLPREDFVPNIDKPIGPGIRLYASPPSGLVLTDPPFALKARATYVLCEVEKFDGARTGVVRTTAYEL